MLPLIIVVTQMLLGWVGWRPRFFDMNHDAHDVNHWSSTKPFSSFPSFLSSPRRCWWNWLLSLRLCCRLQSTLRGHLSQQPLRRGGNWSWWSSKKNISFQSLFELPCLTGRKGRGGTFPASACIKLTGTYVDTGEVGIKLGCWQLGWKGRRRNFDTIFTHWRWWRCVDALLTQALSPLTLSWQGQAAVVLSTLERGSLHATQYHAIQTMPWNTYNTTQEKIPSEMEVALLP